MSGGGEDLDSLLSSKISMTSGPIDGMRTEVERKVSDNVEGAVFRRIEPVAKC